MPEGLRSWRAGRDYPNNSIAKNGRNPETSPWDLRRLAVTQTPVKNHQLTLMWKTLKELIIIIIIINLKRETESLLIAAPNKAIRTNHIKAGIDKTQWNSNGSLRGDRDEMINHIISECSKLAQKEYKARHDWVGKVIHWVMCQKFKFDSTNKWYMHNPSPVLENNTHKHLWDFNIQTDHLISARKLDFIIINKKREFSKLSTSCSGRPQNKSEGKWKER